MLTPARVGQFLICSSKTIFDINFIQLPDLYKLTIPKRDFKRALKYKHVEFVEELTEEHYSVCVANANDNDPLKSEHNFSGMEDQKMNSSEFDKKVVELPNEVL